MRIAILVCTRSQPRDMVQTLTSLGQLAMPAASTCDLIIVNNAPEPVSASEFESHVKTLKTTVLHEPMPGLSRARNTGVAELDADYVIFTDDDVTVPADWLAAYARAFRRYPQAAFFGSDIIPVFPGADSTWAHALAAAAGSCFARFQVGPHDKPIDANSRAALHPFGANMAFRVDALRRFSFDESLGRQPDGLVLSGEETGLVADMVAAGHVGCLIAGNPVNHRISASRQTLEYVRRYYHGQGWLQARNAIKSGGWTARLDRILSRVAVDLFWMLRAGARMLPAKTPAVWLERQHGHFSGRVAAFRNR